MYIMNLCFANVNTSEKLQNYVDEFTTYILYRLQGIYHHIGNNNNNSIRIITEKKQTRLPQKTDIAHWSFVLIIFFVILLRFLLFKLKLNSFFLLRVCNFF